MSVVFHFRAEDMLQCRFAISPLNETADALRSLTDRGRETYHLPWQRQVRQQIPALKLEPLLAVLSIRGYQPDFINPPPESPFAEIDAELDQVRAASPSKVAAELSKCLGGQPAGAVVRRAHPELTEDPARVRDLLASMLRRAWSALIEPWWPRLRDVLDADITFRARRLADFGVAATINDLDRRISWRDGALRFGGTASGEVHVAGTELVLIPSVFTWPRAGVNWDPPSVVYPARGIAQIWHPDPEANRDLARLIGRTRAALLMALAEPASTTGLAARTGIPVSSISEHLATLRSTGLVSTTRTGRFLIHQRTALGIALSAGPGPSIGVGSTNVRSL